MNLGEFDKVYAKKANISVAEAGNHRRLFIDTLKHGLVNDEKVIIRNEFKAELRSHKPTVRRLPDGKLIDVPAKKKVKLTALKGFEDVLELAKV